MRKRPEKQVRIEKIREQLLAGESQYSIAVKLENGEYEWWPDSESYGAGNLKKVIDEALETCQYESMVARDGQKSLHLERYLDLYRDCRQNNDRSNARAILSDIAKLMGLNAPTQVQTDTNYRIKLV